MPILTIKLKGKPNLANMIHTFLVLLVPLCEIRVGKGQALHFPNSMCASVGTKYSGQKSIYKAQETIIRYMRVSFNIIRNQTWRILALSKYFTLRVFAIITGVKSSRNRNYHQ